MRLIILSRLCAIQKPRNYLILVAVQYSLRVSALLDVEFVRQSVVEELTVIMADSVAVCHKFCASHFPAIVVWLGNPVKLYIKTILFETFCCPTETLCVTNHVPAVIVMLVPVDFNVVKSTFCDKNKKPGCPGFLRNYINNK